MGGAFRVFKEDGSHSYNEYTQLAGHDLKRLLYIRNPFAHGSVMFKKQAAIDAGLYTEGIGPIEDYDLWKRMAPLGDFLALPHHVYAWRVNNSGISSTNRNKQMKRFSESVAELWSERPAKVVGPIALRRLQHAYSRSPFRPRKYARTSLEINAQIAIKMIKYRRPVRGTLQLISVMLAAPHGTRVVVARVKKAYRGNVSKAKASSR